MSSAGRGKRGTHADVELDCPEEDQHGRVAVAELDAVDLQVAQDGADGGEDAEQEDEDEADLLVLADVELEQDRDGKHGDDDVGDDGHDGVAREGRARRQARAVDEGLPALVNWSARENQRQGAAQMAHEDEDDRHPHDAAVDDLVGALEEAQVADQEGDLEEADAQLVERPTGIVEARVRNQVFLGPEDDGQAEAVLGL